MKPRSSRPALKRGPLVLLGDGFLLLLLLAGAAGCFVTAFGASVSLPLLYTGCLVCALAFLVVWSLPRHWWLPPLAVIAGLWVLGLWQLWGVLTLGELSLRCSVVNTFRTSLELGGLIEPILQLPDETWTAAATCLLLMGLVPLGALLGLGVVRLRSFWFSFWFSFPFLLLPLCISVTPGWLPLMALVLAWCVLGLTSLARRSSPQRAARLNLVALPAAALLLAGLTAAMPQETYQRPAWADDALEHIINQAVRYSELWFDGTGPFGGGGGGRLSSADGSVSLDNGPLSFSGRTVLEVDTDIRGRIYLRGFSGALYDGESWQPLDEEGAQAFESGQYYGGRRVAIRLDLRGYQPMNFPALAARNARPGSEYASVTVRNVGADPGYVYVPYQILTQPDELSGAAFVHDSYLARAEDVWTHTLYIQPDASPADAGLLTGDAAEAENDYRDFVYSYYRRLPEDQELYDALLSGWESIALALWDGGSYSDYFDESAPEQVIYARMVADYLASVAQYDADTPVTPEGEDYVTYVLTESHQGYCMHFASAAVLMLRSIGIPARYVAGYVTDVPASGHVNVPDSAAHAWVEVYIDGYGWEPVEVTPAYAGSTPGQSGVTEEPEATPTPTPTPQASRGPQESDTPAPTASQAAEETPEAPSVDLRLLLLPLAVLLLLLAFPLRRRLARRSRERRFRDPSTNRAVIAAYLYLRRLGRWGVPMDEEAEALAKKAKFSPHTLTESERETAVTAARAAAQAADAALPRWKKLLFRYILGLY